MKEPKIRFKGFRGEWEEKALGCCVAFWDSMRQPIEEVKRIKGIYPYYGASGVVDYINDYIFDEELILLSEDGANITDRNYPVCFIARGKYWVNNHAHVLKANKGFDNVFLCNNLERKDYTQYNTGMAMPKLNKEVCIRIPVFYPILPEQQSISSYFQHLDSLIQSTTKKIESLKQVKAASLQSMFPQEGETTPRVRFKGFEGEWDTPSISEVFELRNGYTPSKAVEAFWEGGTIPWFRMEDIRENGGILNDAIQHITPLGIKGNGLFEKNSIILSTTATIGVHAMLIADSLANQQFTNFSIRKSLKHTFDPMFVYYSFFGIDEWSKKNTNSGGLLSVNIPLLLKQPYLTPSINEQRAIASYFTTLDRQITLQSKRLEKLKQIKAACLDNMFV